MNGTTDNEAVLRGVLDQWKAGLEAHEPQKIAALFTEDAIFQGLRPYSVGPRKIAEYYDSQPFGVGVEYRIVEARQLAAGLILGYLSVDFAFPDGLPKSVSISIMLKHIEGRWSMSHYQVSYLA
jgi:uncharacterized protein (TIGR02246 family)